MRPWFESHPLVIKALAVRFPGAENEDLWHWATEICNGAATSASIQWIERNNTNPVDDIARLKKAAKKVGEAAEAIGDLGWQGGGAVNALAVDIYKMKAQLASVPALGREGSIEFLRGYLIGLGAQIQSCCDKIDKDANSPTEAIGGSRTTGRSRGRPTETEAYFAARETGRAFQALAQKKPSVVTDRVTGKAGGEFMTLLADVFNALDINASVETWARKIGKEKNPEKS